MKHVVSVSLGSRSRDKRVTVELLGEQVVMERIGTDGDVRLATQLFAEFDGKVDCLGVGGIDLSVGTQGRSYPLHAARRMVRRVQHTPVVDGRGLKFTLERTCMQHVEAELGDEVQPKRAMVNVAIDRYGMTLSLQQAGYELVMGDLQFSLGIPLAIHTLRQLHVLAAIIAPVGGWLPAAMLYPTGERESVPRFTRWYRWATIIAGDCGYTKRHMPPELPGKTILTNTTTEEDVARFREAGVRYLVTTTPRFNGRTFGTNVLESALVAIAGKGRTLSHAELREMIAALELRPQIVQLNE